MPEYNIHFNTPRPNLIEFPTKLLENGQYEVGVDGDCITIMGNRDGLLYLAEVLVRAALGNYSRGFHVHLPMTSKEAAPNTDMRPELTIYPSVS